MRVAFVGKGGSGKSTIVGTFARLLGRHDPPVLVLDSDVMPGLAGALGLAFDDRGIPREAVVPGPEDGPKFVLRPDLTIEQAVEKYALRAPDDVRLLQLGKLRDGAWTAQESLHAFNQIKVGMSRTDWHVIGDLPGGTRQPFMGWSSFARTVAVVVEPTVKSFVTARRMRRLAQRDLGVHLVAVANKVESEQDVQRVAEESGLPVVGSVPLDPAVRDSDRAGTALLDEAPDGPAVAAIAALVDDLRQTEHDRGGEA